MLLLPRLPKFFGTASGIAGDMTLAALIDAGADQDYLVRQIESLGLPDVRLVVPRALHSVELALDIFKGPGSLFG